MRAIASPTVVVRRRPTCISFATLGEEYSTATVCGPAGPFGAEPLVVAEPAARWAVKRLG
jgi:hypothetical protein